MIHIPLTQSKVALIDDEDWDLVSRYLWLAYRRKGGNTYRARASIKLPSGALHMHRLIMGLKQNDPLQVDHINGNGLDNRRSNLRIATPAQNAQNRQGANANSGTGVRGVYRKYHHGSWYYVAKVVTQGRTHLKLFRCATHTLEEAATWTREKRQELGFPSNNPTTDQSNQQTQEEQTS